MGRSVQVEIYWSAESTANFLPCISNKDCGDLRNYQENKCTLHFFPNIEPKNSVSDIALKFTNIHCHSPDVI